MAIALKTTKDYAFNLMKDIGVSPSLIAQAQSAGVVADNSLNGSILIKANGATYGSIVIKASALTLIKNGLLGPASKDSFKFQFETALQKAIDAMASGKAFTQGGGFKLSGSETGSLKSSQPNFQELPKKHVAFDLESSSQPTPPETHDMPDFSMLSPKKVKPFAEPSKVALKDATKLYQSVHGTTAGALYLVFARFNNLNLAVKVDGLSFSIRAEGSALPLAQPALSSFGIDNKGGYASGHFGADSTELLIKALGAVAALIGFDKLIEIGDIKKIIKESE